MRKNAEENCKTGDADGRVCESASESRANLAAPFPEFRTSGKLNDPQTGRFVLGNRGGNYKHGAYSKAVKAIVAGEIERAEVRAALAERQAEIVADMGGRDAVSALALGLVDRQARLEMVEMFLWENVQTLGPLTKGKTRAALTAWLSVVDRLHRSALALGLERKRKPINPLDAVRAAVAEANK